MRQPATPKMVWLDMGVAIMPEANIPKSREDCTLPKILPRLLSEVASATMPLEIGRRAARAQPSRARRATMGGTTAPRLPVVRPSSTVITPWLIAPMIRMLRRRRQPRSAMIPQRGAAMFVQTVWARARYARSVKCSPTFFCSANMTAGSSAVSAPSSALTAQRRKSIRRLGSRSSSSFPAWSVPGALAGVSAPNSGVPSAAGADLPSAEGSEPAVPRSTTMAS